MPRIIIEFETALNETRQAAMRYELLRRAGELLDQYAAQDEQAATRAADARKAEAQAARLYQKRNQ